VVVAEPVDAPVVLAKTRVDVAFTFEEGAVFHTGQALGLEKARGFIRESEARFVALATSRLKELVAAVDAKLVAAGMAAPAEKNLPPLEKILLAHPLLHAAEGELYRRVFVEATAAVAARPARTPADALAAHIAKAIDRTPANVVTRLAAMGKASGKPWAADQKNAALAAWLALATSRSARR